MKVNFKTKRLVLFGTGDLAQIAAMYFTRDTEYEVVGFTVDDEYLKEEILIGLPVVPFSKVQNIFPPDAHEMHICVLHNNMNRTRATKYKEAENKGYKLASYISPAAFVSSTARIGKNVFLFEFNVVQDFVVIGDNVIGWSGSHFGHSSIIEDNNFITSHVVISGHCKIESNCFLGVNATIGDRVVIGHDSWVSSGANISRSVPPHSLVRSIKSEVTPLNEEALFKSLGK